MASLFFQLELYMILAFLKDKLRTITLISNILTNKRHVWENESKMNNVGLCYKKANHVL